MFSFFKTQKKYATVPAAEFKRLLDGTPAVLLDVRTPGEFRQNTLKGAINIDVRDGSFAEQTANLDKSKTYLVYCQSGMRSGKACEYLADKGFTNLYNLSGGLSGWPY